MTGHGNGKWKGKGREKRLPHVSFDTRVDVRFRGTKRVLWVDLEGTILEFKKRFEERFKVHAASIMVGFEGRELDDAQVVKDCGIKRNDIVRVEEMAQEIVHHDANAQNAVTFQINSFISSPNKVTMPSWATVGMLKELLATAAGLSAKILALLDNGQQLHADEDALLEIGIENGGLIELDEDVAMIAVRWFDNFLIHLILSKLNAGEDSFSVSLSRAQFTM